MKLKGVEGGDCERRVGGERRRAKSLRNGVGVHHADGVVWGPVYRTHLIMSSSSASESYGVERNPSNFGTASCREGGRSRKASVDVVRRRGRASKGSRGDGRRDAPGEKVLKERRSPRRRGRMGTSVVIERACPSFAAFASRRHSTVDFRSRHFAPLESTSTSSTRSFARNDLIASPSPRRIRYAPSTRPAGKPPPAWVKRSVSRTSYRSNVEREARVKSDDGKSP